MAAQVTTIKARIGSDIRIRLSDVDEVAAAQIRAHLTVVNKPKQVALDRGEWGAEDMPDSFAMWRHIGEDIVVPRGFAAVLREGLGRIGHDVEWVDETSAVPVPLVQMAAMNEIALRPEQEVAARELIRHRQGVLQAPTSSGKTIVGLEVFRRVGLQCVVLVNSVGLAEQWRERAREHLSVEAGLVGDGSWEIKPLTIALLQSLHSAGKTNPTVIYGFFRMFGMTILDEAHHITAESYRDILRNCCTSFLIGKTATPLEGDWRRPVLEFMIGPIVHRMASTVADPEVLIVKTDFSWKPSGREKALVDSRAIYRHVIKALEGDDERVDLIARTILAQPPESAQLVVCKRLAYLESILMRLCLLGYERERIFFMRGAETRIERARVAELADDGGCVVLSTVADEGIDIPRLDRIHLTWPARKVDSIVQQVGRILRDHPEKLSPVVIDYVDAGNGMLRAQSYSRMNGVYRKRGWSVQQHVA